MVVVNKPRLWTVIHLQCVKWEYRKMDRHEFVISKLKCTLQHLLIKIQALLFHSINKNMKMYV